MYTKTLTYTDFKGQDRTESFSFNMTEVELMRWASMPGGYSKDQFIEKLMGEENNVELIDLIESLLRASYGEVSLDGKRFIKTPEVQANFFETNAYPKLFLELAANPAESARFFDEVFPGNLAETIARIKTANEQRDKAVASAQSAAAAAIPSVTNA